ncbi:MAG: Zn-ribbon domain-containing OB-fold protein [Candidatus Kariarchaeaceae archaeon]|jgi:uncharacterized OB-fold protein
MTQTIFKDGLPYLVEKSISMSPFWEGLNSKELKSTKCTKCNTIHFPPSPKLCPICFNFSMEWINLPLEGTISTWTNVLAPPEGFLSSYYLISVIIDTLGKPILGRYLGEKPKIGDRVLLDFEDVSGQSVWIFKNK